MKLKLALIQTSYKCRLQHPQKDDSTGSHDRQPTKRHITEENNVSSIADINTTQKTTLFEGDVLVTYGPAYAKNLTSPAKAPMVHADLIDSNSYMTITANITNQLIDKFMTKLLPGASVRIKNFSLKKKTQYERGDADFCIQFTAQTSIETIDQVCNQQKLMPDTRICQLIHSSNNYSIGTLGVIVAAHKQTPKEYELNIKDGESILDTSIVTVPEFHAQAYTTLHEILHSTTTPLLLLKNVVRSGPRGTNSIKTTPSTYVASLNDESTIKALKNILSSSIQVTGTLTTRNAYLQPYQLLCIECNQPTSLVPSSTTRNGQCIACGKNTDFAYGPFLQCTIQTEDKNVDCTMSGKMLQQYLPQLADIPFQTYKKNISTVVYLLKTFQIQGTFSIAMNDNIISV